MNLHNVKTHSERFAASGHFVTVDVIAKSRFSRNAGITSFVATYPRILHAELMTHRLFSRNAASSRAMPISAMIARVRAQMFVPWHWLANKRGMSGGGPLPHDVADECRERWIADAEHAMESAAFYEKRNVLKGLANRPLEPFSYIQTLITARTEALPHFFNLRNDRDAEDHFQDVADVMERNIAAAPEEDTRAHLPFITADEKATNELEQCLRVSSVRSRRVSYFGMPTVVDGVLVFPKEPPAWKDDLTAASEMISAEVKHASPFEHPCFATRGNLAGLAGNLALPGERIVDFVQYRKKVTNEFTSARRRRA